MHFHFVTFQEMRAANITLIDVNKLYMIIKFLKICNILVQSKLKYNYIAIQKRLRFLSTTPPASLSGNCSSWFTSCATWCPAAPVPSRGVHPPCSAGSWAVGRSACRTQCICWAAIRGAAGTPHGRCARPSPLLACPGPPPAGAGCPCKQKEWQRFSTWVGLEVGWEIMASSI